MCKANCRCPVPCADCPNGRRPEIQVTTEAIRAAIAQSLPSGPISETYCGAAGQLLAVLVDLDLLDAKVVLEYLLEARLAVMRRLPTIVAVTGDMCAPDGTLLPQTVVDFALERAQKMRGLEETLRDIPRFLEEWGLDEDEALSTCLNDAAMSAYHRGELTFERLLVTDPLILFTLRVEAAERPPEQD